jgi:hypothetical protein
MGPGDEPRLRLTTNRIVRDNSYQQALCSAQPTDDPMHEADRNSRAWPMPLRPEPVLRMATSYMLRPHPYRCRGGRCVSLDPSGHRASQAPFTFVGTHGGSQISGRQSPRTREGTVDAPALRRGR